MNIGLYSFEEFKALATKFHGYPAPGLLIGGYMVELAKQHLPEDTLFEAISESTKCLPDAVQLLTLCSIGNNWLKVHNLGRYAVSLYDKFSGEGVRVAISSQKLANWPEINAWFFKLKPKAQQDSNLLMQEIREAGASFCNVEKIQVLAKFLGKHPSSKIANCPICEEAYPSADGAICRGCQGDGIYTQDQDKQKDAPLKSVPVAEAIGKEALHDMTQIIPGEFKDAAFVKGQILEIGDLCRLQQMGKNNVYLAEDNSLSSDWVHENEAVEAFATAIAGTNISYAKPREGKIDFVAVESGLLKINVDILEQFNLLPDVMLATRHNLSVVEAGKKVAGCRIIPLYTAQKNFQNAMRVLRSIDEEKLISILPLRKAQVGVLITGTEIFQGLVNDRFAPIIRNKIAKFNGNIVQEQIVPDQKEAIIEAINHLKEQNVDLIITTGGMSVDPDDITRAALTEAGMQELAFGIPVLPGTMTLLGKMQHNNKQIDILGVPACALHYKTTGFDLLLPRVLAGHTINKIELAKLAQGGFCLQCKACTFPKCGFGK